MIAPCVKSYIFHLQHLIVQLRPLSVFLEERLLLRLALFFGLCPISNGDTAKSRGSPSSGHSRTASWDAADRGPDLAANTSNAKRYYFGILQIVPGQV